MKEQSHLHLYRKYRPQTFADLVGQKHIQTTLKHEIESGSFSHAYLFCGPRGLGKTSSARILAKALNCEAPKKGEPDLSCASCRAIGEGRFLDLIEMDAASNTGVDHVREHLIAAARVVPSQGKVKVFIVDEVHMLSISAFNALLKTLEEPPAATVFILATTEIHKVPETILSRCERFDFKKIAPDEMIQRLQWITTQEKRKVEKEVLELIAQRSDGCQRDAENLLDQVLSLDDQKITLEMASLVLPHSDFEAQISLSAHLSQRNLVAIFEQIQVMMEEGIDMEVLMKDLIEFWRKLLVMSVHRQVGLLASMTKDVKQQKTIQEILKQVSSLELVGWIEELLLKKQQFSATALAQLPLELAAVALCRQKDVDLSGGLRPTENVVRQAPAVAKASAGITMEAVAIPEGVVVVGEVAEVKKVWTKILRETRKINHALMLTLKVAVITKVSGSVVTLGFRYKFYRDRISDRENKRLLEDIFEQALGRKCSIECEIDERLPMSMPMSPRPQTSQEQSPAANDEGKMEAGDGAVVAIAANSASLEAAASGNVWDLVNNTLGNDFTKKATS